MLKDGAEGVKKTMKILSRAVRSYWTMILGDLVEALVGLSGSIVELSGESG